MKFEISLKKRGASRCTLTQPNKSPAGITAYMGKPREQGGVAGWVPYHPAISQAIAPHMPPRDQNLSAYAAMFLTVCFQLRGKSTVAGGGWIEKTTADWMKVLGASKRTIEFVIRFMCYDDKTGTPLGVTCLGLVRRRRNGFRNSAQYLVDELRANAFWLTHGPQPALRGQLEIQAPKVHEVDSLVSHEVDSLVSHEVDSLVSHEVDSLVSQPHKKHTKYNTDETQNSVDVVEPPGSQVSTAWSSALGHLLKEKIGIEPPICYELADLLASVWSDSRKPHEIALKIDAALVSLQGIQAITNPTGKLISEIRRDPLLTGKRYEVQTG